MKGQPPFNCYSHIKGGNAAWKDQLTNYNGTAIAYDAIGNPLNWRNDFTFTWQNGRELASAANASTAVTYTYNQNGIRTSKTVNGVKTTYVLDENDLLMGEITGENTIVYLYDENNSIYGFAYNGTPYYYLFNGQGDVMRVIDETGTVVASYNYDAWGKVITATGDMAAINPIRYRGYYYDAETELYYLQSRYYDAAITRFLNADDPMFLGISGGALSYNLWTYCYNSSVNFADLTGTSPIQVVLAALFGVIGFDIADCIARGLGLFPSGKGFWNAAKYWALTGAIAVGGAAIGWFAGAAITKIVVAYISKRPAIIIRIANKCGGSLFSTIMCFLGINPFNYVSNASQLTALARALNSSWFALPKAWAQAFCSLAEKMGRKLFFDVPHGRYGYHIHLGGQNGQKLERLHFQVVKSVWSFLKRIFGR